MSLPNYDSEYVRLAYGRLSSTYLGLYLWEKNTPSVSKKWHLKIVLSEIFSTLTKIVEKSINVYIK
jgi:hypothetical protein